MKLNIVPARTGFTWVALGIRTFFRQPLALAGLFFLYTAAGSIASLVPYVGPIVGLMIVPAATLGLMVAAQEAERGRFPMPTVLVSAFRAGRQRLRAMLILGALYAAACVAVVLLASMLFPDAPKAAAGEPAGLQELAPVFLIALFYVPVSVLFWHAPALVHWHGVPPLKSLFFSLVACMRNLGAFSLFALAWGGIIIALSLPLGMLVAVMGGAQTGLAIVGPVMVAFAAMFSTSIYFTFRDSFIADTDEPGPGAVAPAEPPAPPDFTSGDAP